MTKHAKVKVEPQHLVDIVFELGGSRAKIRFSTKNIHQK
jgi:hypothetical protein